MGKKQVKVVSPVLSVPEVKESEKMDFGQAIKAILDGVRITRLIWNDNNVYAFLKEGQLCYSIKGELHTWALSRTDLEAKDWVVAEQN